MVSGGVDRYGSGDSGACGTLARLHRRSSRGARSRPVQSAEPSATLMRVVLFESVFEEQRVRSAIKFTILK